jgi:hypothetical protein
MNVSLSARAVPQKDGRTLLMKKERINLHQIDEALKQVNMSAQLATAPILATQKREWPGSMPPHRPGRFRSK